MAHRNTGELYVGLDYHDNAVQVCGLDPHGQVMVNRSVANHWQAVVDATKDCGHVRRVAIEACCGAADLADELTNCAGWPMQLAHPTYVARLKRSPDKSDYSDAQLLADLTRVGYLPAAWLPSTWTRELRRLVRYRQQQVDERRNAKLRITALVRDHRLKRPSDANPWTKAWWSWLTTLDRLPAKSAWIVERQRAKIDHLTDEIKQVEQQLWQHAAEDQLTMRLLDEPQVGPVTAWVLRSEIDQFDRFNTGKSLARFAGVTPRNASSGSRQSDAGMIRAGSSLLRATLVELAHRLGRREPHWCEMKQRMRRGGKKTNVITVAVANRWLRQLHHRIVTWQHTTQRQMQCAAQRNTQREQMNPMATISC